MKKINIGLIGHKFMGRAHTHGYTDVPIFFNTGVEVVKKTLCSNENSVINVAKQWGFQTASLDWRNVVNDPEIDVIDIAAPSAIHAEVAIAAAQAGKHIFCEKPLALSLKDAKQMLEAVQKAGVVNCIGFNYRKVPALVLAKKLIEDGSIGNIYHFRGIYQQDWLVDPAYPLVWRLKKKDAGYGSHGDMGAHVIDIARFLVGDIAAVSCVSETFVKNRPVLESADGLRAVAGDSMGEVDVDDASIFIFRFSNRNTLGYFEATRYGSGHRNQNRIEINGSKGSLIFDMEKMNELQYYSCDDPSDRQGFRRIQVGESCHAYMENWWPAGHIIGYGETFVNQAYDFICGIRDGNMVHPDFEDGYICQQVLDAADRSSKTGTWINVGN
ncbi:MAG: Gfo/Idh/MocA family oxidoreductase [Bacteroidetes bacterium]|nr:Gfo/Idh/MocA family oxidoreductase [Bacteroidota bacterium]